MRSCYTERVTEVKVHCFAIMADEDNNSDSFPGLNKAHGFFKAIERNQRDRDLYHKQTEERRNEARRGRRRDRKHPERGIYQPPHLRNRETTPRTDMNNPSLVYKLEIEVAPKQWHRQNIEKIGKGSEVANSLKERYSLTEIQRDAIQEMIEEFERSLKL